MTLSCILFRMLSRHVAFALALIGLLAPQVAAAQAVPPSPAPSPAPSSSAAGESPTGGAFDMSKLTPEQQAALQQYIIKTSQNPVGNIAVIPLQSNLNFGLGPYARYQYNLNVQPVVPFMLSKDMSLIARTIVPLVSQPPLFATPQQCANPGCAWTFGVGDIQEQLFFAPKTKPGELIWGAGPIFQVPSASPDTLGTGKYSVGPAAVALVMPGPWVMGMLATQLWSFAGKANRPGVNSGLFQPFVNYNIKGGWALTTAPIITVNYNAPGNQKWAIPIGGGGSKTFKLGDQPMQLAVLYYTFVQKPVTSPQTNLRISFSLLFPIKRGFDLKEALQEAGVTP
ncbi:MAG: neuromedin U [Candidatus Eremiobacteraeota bacterium]|nr:neuromedin U [Candidatus Eremiobacteraeota bacterium]